MNLDVSPRPAFACRGSRVAAVLAVALGSLVLPAGAEAQEVVVVNKHDSAEPRGPSWMLFSSGVLMFGGTYTASFVVAATSNTGGDKWLYAPLVGPWLDIATRCPAPCNGDVGNKVLLGFDGVFQGIGAITVLTSFVAPVRRWGRVALGDQSPVTLQVLPASVGRGAPGLSAIGTF